MTWVTLSAKSENAKTGPIPVSMTEEKSCPNECPLKGTDCYARFSYLGISWRKVGKTKNSSNWEAFCQRVGKFVSGQLWRHNQAGDLPKNSRGKLNKTDCLRLAKAAAHTRGWTYTHYDPTNEHNKGTIAKMNRIGGLVVNLSADSLKEADDYVGLGIGPVVITLPSDTPHRQNRTPLGVPIVICPAQTNDSMTCAQCKLCQIRDRKSIVGFLAHGAAKKRLSTKLS